MPRKWSSFVWSRNKSANRDINKVKERFRSKGGKQRSLLKFKCPRCKGFFYSKKPICPDCKTKLREFKCPICNEIHYSNQALCPKCNKEFKEFECPKCKGFFYSKKPICPDCKTKLKEFICPICNEIHFSTEETCSKCKGETRTLKVISRTHIPKERVNLKEKENEMTKLKRLTDNIKHAQIYSPDFFDFLKLKYLNIYKDYIEILFLEYGMRFKPSEIIEPPLKLIRKINLERYYKLGKINHKVNIICEKCHYEFFYIYKGGPHRKYCPFCSDWIKKFPLEDESTYSRTWNKMENKL